jgi:hypothetical protein
MPRRLAACLALLVVAGCGQGDERADVLSFNDCGNVCASGRDDRR